MGMEFELIPPGTRVGVNGEGQKVDVSGSRTQTFLSVLEITEQVEQESIDVSIWGSEDGDNWGAKPILKLPQRFYRGETRMVLDLTSRPEVKFIKAKWELFRWGRVAPLPMFVVGLRCAEVADMPRREAAAGKVAMGD
jgi:hypothetical protein